MKTKYLKITSFILAGIFCLAFSNADARKPTGHSKNHYTSRKKLSSSALASMKINNIQFGFNKATVPDEARSNLDKVTKLMKDNKASIKVEGYADSKGGYVYNWKLSQARAESVKAYMVSQGADSSRIAATEFGYTHPIASNKTASGRKKNRRVEIKFAN